jgi:hypothetical protein
MPYELDQNSAGQAGSILVAGIELATVSVTENTFNDRGLAND